MLRLGPRIVPGSGADPEPSAGTEPVPGVGSGARFGTGAPCEEPSRPAAKLEAVKASRQAASVAVAIRRRIDFQKCRLRGRADRSGVSAEPMVVPTPTEHQIAAFRRSVQCRPARGPRPPLAHRWATR